MTMLRLTSLLLLLATAAAPATLREQFQNPPDDARIMMRWWWFGPSVDKPELEREMRAMKQGGMGGFEVQSTYPLSLERNYPYLSYRFLEMLRFTAIKAKELGLRMDLTLGSGWPFGGPHIPVTQAAGRLRVERTPNAPLEDGESVIATIGPNTFISSRTGMQVKRPSLNAEGFVLDHYDRAGIDNHLKMVGERFMEAFKGIDPPYAIFSDSLEVFGSDWTPNLLQEFQRRRGYDLTPYLPALVGDIGENTGAIRNDWGKTLAELCDENYLIPMTEWAHKHGTKFRSQTYGTPPVTMSSSRLVDLAEGEHGPHWRGFSVARWASSANHLYGKTVTSTETWTWLHSPTFRATPLDMKAEADLHFLSGVNQLVGHGWPYSPPEAGEPGWRFYASAVFNDHNPWWNVMPDIAKYLQRMSFLLRQGKSATELAIYLPTADARAKFKAGQNSLDRSFEPMLAGIVPRVLDAGFNFDFIDDQAIESVGIPHRILILPNIERIPLATLQKIVKARKVIAVNRAPSLAPGLKDPPIGDLAKSLHVVKEDELGAALAALHPDFFTPVPAVGFIHRVTDAGDIYFIANTGNQPVHTAAQVSITGRDAEWWDPHTGAATRAELPLRLDLEPYESRVLFFPIAKSTAPPAAPVPGRQLATLDFSHTEPWPPYFSGRRDYKTTVTLNESGRVFLDFGAATAITGDKRANGMQALVDSPVREAAVIYVNGQRAGSVWSPPYRIEITRQLRHGANEIRIEVANTAINKLAGEPLPKYRLLDLRYGNRFQPQDMENLKPLPSGLFGKVRLLGL